jgi:hypothetical protein
MASGLPTLNQILLDNAPPPWTLNAFMVYLSEKHCMENLEFILDSDRYTAIYSQLAAEKSHSRQSTKQVCGLWEKLMQTYIVPHALREINIPSDIRDQLLRVSRRECPPHPSKLNEANQIILELINDSLLAAFVQSAAPRHVARSSYDPLCSPLHYTRNSSDCGVGDDSKSLASRRIAETGGVLKHEDNPCPPIIEPLAPPTAPPMSERPFQVSRNGCRFAVAAQSKVWKKLRAKLGFGRRFQVGVNHRSPWGSSYDASSP